jgi:hypothetical protein
MFTVLGLAGFRQALSDTWWPPKWPGAKPLARRKRLESQALAKTQAERVDRAERHAADGMTDSREQRAHFCCAEHRQQHAGLVDAEQLEHWPVATERVGAEERTAQTATLMLEGPCFFCSRRYKK